MTVRAPSALGLICLILVFYIIMSDKMKYMGFCSWNLIRCVFLLPDQLNCLENVTFLCNLSSRALGGDVFGFIWLCLSYKNGVYRMLL